MPPISRRSILGGALAGASMGLATAGVSAAMLAKPALAQDAVLRIGLMLPFSGTYAALGESIASAFDMHLKELGGKLGGRPAELVRVDDESDPAAAQSHVNRLLGRERAEVLVGTVHSGVVMALVQAARESS